MKLKSVWQAWVGLVSGPVRRRRRALRCIERLESRTLLTAIFTEGFEGVFPGSNWTTTADDGRVWDDTSDRAHTGGWSGYASEPVGASEGYTHNYTNGLNTTFERTVDLTNYRNVSLSFWRYLNTEADYDFLRVIIQNSSQTTALTPTLSGNHQSWTKETMQLPTWAWDQSGIKVRFVFFSDGSSVPASPSGVWIDDLILEGTVDNGAPPEGFSIIQTVGLPFNQFGEYSLNSTISSASDIELGDFRAEATGNYTFTVSGPVDAQFRLYDDSGTPLSAIIDGSGGGGTESFTANLTAGEHYLFAVGGFNTSTGAFTLSINGPSISTTAVTVDDVEFFKSGTGQLNYSVDQDFFSVVAPLKAETLNITVSPGANTAVALALLDSGGNVIVNEGAFKFGTVSIDNFSVAPGVPYVLRVRHVGGPASSYSYTFDFDPDDFGDPPDTLTNLDLGYTLLTNPFGVFESEGEFFEGTSVIETAQEYEVFPYYAQVTGQHSIDIDGSADGLDVQLRIYDQNGNAITDIIDNFGALLGESYTGSFTAGQTYYFVVAGGSIDTGEFNFTIHSPPNPSVDVITSGVERIANINETVDLGGEADFYKIVAPPGATTLKLFVDPSAELRTYAILYDQTGADVDFGSSFDPGESFDITSAVTAGQTYYLAVGGDTTQSGTYDLRVDFDPNLTGPKITQVEQTKDAKGKKVTALVLTFDKELIQSTTQAIAGNYELKVKKGSKTVAVVISGASYNNQKVTLTLAKAIPLKKLPSYTLKVLGNGSLTDILGAHLDGDANGVPGGDYTKVLG